MKREYKWVGEKIVEKTVVEDSKHTPKDMIQGLDMTRADIAKMEEQLVQINSQIKQINKNISFAKEHEKKLAVFEHKCVELQKAKLNMLLGNIKDECKAIADKRSDEMIAKDPDAYTEEQMNNLKYVNYQKELATHEKIREKICKRIITDYLYDTPIFKNPYKG